jgi:hypothetical protein
MAKKDLYSSLQAIALQALGTQKPTESATKKITETEINNLKKNLSNAEAMYPLDTTKRFQYWKKNTDISGLSPEAKSFYWDTYATLNPKGLDGAKTEYLNITRNELNVIGGSSNKEFFLREKLATAPEWVKKDLEPELAKISTMVANSNYVKSTKVYEQDARNRINTFLFKSELDPDVAIEDHANDLVKLEQLNLMDIAQVINGRVGVYRNETFMPGFAIADRNEVLPDDIYGTPSVEEQLKVKETVSPLFKEAVETNLYSARRTISREEQQANEAAIKMLEEGKFTIDRWQEAFSINPEAKAEDQILSGIRGEISAKRVKSYSDLAQTIFSALNSYGPMLGVNTNAE